LSDDYICYNLRCPDRPPDLEVQDQFGARRETHMKTSLLCVPARQVGISSTTSSSSTTTTSTSPSTTTPVNPPCIGTPTLDPDNVVTVKAGVPAMVPVLVNSTTGGEFSLSLSDGTVGGQTDCPGAACDFFGVSMCGAMTITFVYTPPASSPPSITLDAFL